MTILRGSHIGLILAAGFIGVLIKPEDEAENGYIWLAKA